MSISYQVPKSTIQLPSEGILYPENSSLSNGSIEIHHMTAREEDILSSSNLLKQGRALDELLLSCIESLNVDPLEILTCDRNALFVAIRISGFGQNYPIQIQCPQCNKFQTHIVDLSSLNAKTCSELGTIPLQPHHNLFEYKLPNTGLVIKFKLMNGRDEQTITQYQEKVQQVESSKNNLVISNEKEITLRMKQMIVSINDETSRNVISDAINTLPAMDSRSFRKHVESIEPGLVMKTLFTCKYCSNEEVVDIPISTDFFWPPL